MPDLQPFLDLFPAPLHWRLETREEAEALKEGIFQKNEVGVRKSLISAEKQKSKGNAAFAKKDQSGALAAYSDAIKDVFDALSQNPDIEEEKRAKKQLATCYGNRAAAYSMPGGAPDPQKALQNGKSAEEADSASAKA